MNKIIIFDRESIFALKNSDLIIDLNIELLNEIKLTLNDKYLGHKKYIRNKPKRKEDYAFRFNKKNYIVSNISDEEKNKKQIVGILNKITSLNIETLSTSIKELIDTNNISYLIDIIFNNSIIQPNNCITYVNLCKNLSNYINDMYSIKIEDVILDKCNLYFYEIKKDSFKNDQNNYDDFCYDTKKKNCNIGNIQLIGELYNNDLVNSETIHNILDLISNSLNNYLDDKDLFINYVECFCKLILITYIKNNDFIINYYDIIKKNSINKKYPPKSRFCFMDLIDIYQKLDL